MVIRARLRVYRKMLIKLEEVQKAYGSAEVLKGVSFQVNPGEHAGLVGRNGAGKTTIFRLIAGKEDVDKGIVSKVRGLKLGVLDQQPVFDLDATVRGEALRAFSEIQELEQDISRLEHEMAEASGPELEEVLEEYSELRHRHELLEGFSYEARAESVLTGLGFKEADFDALAVHLSGGQKARLALARMLLSQPSLLLLDEPTNHLDIQASEWLEEFLIGYGSAFIIISHDRFLLDRVAT
ncbi:MAG: ATP-binding cassette domain-containing protein, partial [Blastocatellia bacterium]